MFAFLFASYVSDSRLLISAHKQACEQRISSIIMCNFLHFSAYATKHKKYDTFWIISFKQIIYVLGGRLTLHYIYSGMPILPPEYFNDYSKIQYVLSLFIFSLPSSSFFLLSTRFFLVSFPFESNCLLRNLHLYCFSYWSSRAPFKVFIPALLSLTPISSNRFTIFLRSSAYNHFPSIDFKNE